MPLIWQPLLRAAVLATTEDSQGVPLYIKICLVTDSGERVNGNADINLNDAVTSGAGQGVEVQSPRQGTASQSEYDHARATATTSLGHHLVVRL